MSRIQKTAVISAIIAPVFTLAGCVVDTDRSADSTDMPSVSSPSQNSDSTGVALGAEAAKADDDLTLNDMLTYAMQDEHLARASYDIAINDLGAGKPFTNIVNSEEQHVSMLTPLFDEYKVEPVDGEEIAKYAPVPITIKGALETCVEAEIVNIAMYERFLEQELPADVREVFEHLKYASENHLRAFENNLSRY